MREVPSSTEANVVEQFLLGLLMRPLGRPSVTAVVIGVFTFALMWWLNIGELKDLLDWWFYPEIPREVRAWFIGTLFWPIYAYAQYLVPGFVAGVVAFRKGLMHGLIVGTAAPFVILAIPIGSLNWWHIWAAVLALPLSWALCGAGGVAADLFRVLLVRLIRGIRAA